MNCCEDTGCIIPIGQTGIKGLKGRATNGSLGIPEKVAFDTSLNIIATIGHGEGIVQTPTLPIVGWFVFPGTLNLDIIPNKCYVVMSSSTTWNILIRNSAGQVVCETSSLHNITPTLVNMGQITNLPQNTDVFTIEVNLLSTGGYPVIYLYYQINIFSLTLDLE